MTITTIPLKRLALSDANVRKGGELNIDQLAADIAARGVLQNLLVCPGKRGSYAVFAGGRRLKALQSLCAAGTIADDYEVPVRVLKADTDELAETSLAENFQRMAMSPADECAAFQHFLGEHGDLDAVAKRFGVTRRFVEGRLRLANLAPVVFTALSEGTITLDMATAYATVADHERQTAVFEQYGRYSYTTPDQIRRALAQTTLSARDPIAILVGEEAYVAAGGLVERELFSEEHSDRWTNPDLARELAVAKMEAEAKEIAEREGYDFVLPVSAEQLYQARGDFHRVPLPVVPMSDEETARCEAIDARIEELTAILEDEETDEDAYQAADTEYDELQDELRKLDDRPRVLPAEIKHKVGVFLVLGRDGNLALEETFYSREPIAFDDEGGVREAGAGGSRPTAPAAPVDPTAADPSGKKISAKLFDQLAVQRRDILAAAMIGNPQVALDYMLFVLADATGMKYVDHGTTLKAGRPQDPCLSKDVPPARARDFISDAHEALDQSWIKGTDIGARFDAFRGLSDDAKAAWLAYIVATSLKANGGSGYSGSALVPFHNNLAALLEVDVASWWRPTAENYFDRVSKTASLAAMAAVGGSEFAGRYAGSKKAELAAACEKLFSGDAIVEPEIKEAAVRWVPATMTFTETAGAPEDELDELDDDDASEADDASPGETGSGDDDEVVETPEDLAETV